MKNFLLIRSAVLAMIIFVACQSEPVLHVDGGHEFPKYISRDDSNSYRLPIRDEMPRWDSFQWAYYGPGFYSAYDEPNLSLGPWHTAIFRLIYSEPMGDDYLITITRKQAIIKKAASKPIERYYDEMRLNEIERDHYQILHGEFPINEGKSYPPLKRYLDSIAALYPQLLDPKYYRSLLDKMKTVDKIPFKYTVKKISVSEKSFLDLFAVINASRFWNLPYDRFCSGIPTDAAGVSLEGNAGKKYNMVYTASCTNDTSAFIKACQQLVNLAGMQKEIHLIWE